MSKKSTSAKSATNASVASKLAQVLARLDAIEKAIAMTAHQSGTTKSAQQAVLLEKLERLTIKRHAVLMAAMGRVSYAEIAKIMNCSETTVKLLLRGALDVLGIKDRNVLIVSWPQAFNFIQDAEYERLYGLSKRWWLTPNATLLSVLQAKKGAKNQYTK